MISLLQIPHLVVAVNKMDLVDYSEEKYQGHTLLHMLETVHVSADKNFDDFRFPVQSVLRPKLDFRGFSGTITSGTISVGEEITALPSGKASRIKSIVTYDE